MSVAVVGLGNLILSDEGVGVHVVRRLDESYSFPDDVVLIDGGTSAIDLLDQLVEAEHIIFIDAAQTGGPPGSIVALQGARLPVWFRERMSPHQIGLADLLATLSLMDHTPESVTLIGIEPQSMELGTELTPQIDAAADEALVKVLEQLAALGVRAVERSGRARPMPCV
ncbi:MAG TPA: HyaD/HybD family hydrogenase maturation endopeptidase [Rhodoplanes sp.]|jgi:hydrogenase maturation protease|nr:HyaD/HybD family hydrogenase maturation endopeptidase [Rhodoplanes sp.]